MKTHRSADHLHIDLTGAEAAVLLDELENVRGGARLPKVRQLCESLRASIALVTPPEPKRRGRSPGSAQQTAEKRWGVIEQEAARVGDETPRG
jgi:hypothetical protein